MRRLTTLALLALASCATTSGRAYWTERSDALRSCRNDAVERANELLAEATDAERSAGDERAARKAWKKARPALEEAFDAADDTCAGRAPARPVPPPRRPVDSDADGLANDLDRCPDVPEDKDGFEDADGCPDADNDGDGVIDSQDYCPNEPGPAPKGCP